MDGESPPFTMCSMFRGLLTMSNIGYKQLLFLRTAGGFLQGSSKFTSFGRWPWFRRLAFATFGILPFRHHSYSTLILNVPEHLYESKHNQVWLPCFVSCMQLYILKLVFLDKLRAVCGTFRVRLKTCAITQSCIGKQI